MASKLGRVSSGMSLEPVDKPQEEDAAFMIQIEVALEKIYGPEKVAVPASVVEVEAKPITPPAALVAAPLANSQT